MKVFGYVLVLLGIVALLDGGISYNRQMTVLDVGPLKTTANQQKNVPLPPIVGGIALVTGLVLLAVRERRTV